MGDQFTEAASPMKQQKCKVVFSSLLATFLWLQQPWHCSSLRRPDVKTFPDLETLRRCGERDCEGGFQDCRPVVVQRVWPGCTPPHPSARRAGGCRSQVLLQLPPAALSCSCSCAGAFSCIGVRRSNCSCSNKSAFSEHGWSWTLIQISIQESCQDKNVLGREFIPFVCSFLFVFIHSIPVQSAHSIVATLIAFEDAFQNYINLNSGLMENLDTFSNVSKTSIFWNLSDWIILNRYSYQNNPKQTRPNSANCLLLHWKPCKKQEIKKNTLWLPICCRFIYFSQKFLKSVSRLFDICVHMWW